MVTRRPVPAQWEAAIHEGFYNPRRRHSTIGYVSLIDYERRLQQTVIDPDVRQPAVVLGAVKDKLFGRPQEGAILTAAVRHGRATMRVGTKQWLRRGAEQRMPRSRRTVRYKNIRLDPKLSTLHESGVQIGAWHHGIDLHQSLGQH